MTTLNNKVIALSEKRISKLLPILNLEISGYIFVFNETEFSARDTSIYIAKKIEIKSCSESNLLLQI